MFRQPVRKSVTDRWLPKHLETSVTTNNSTSRYYTNPDDQSITNNWLWNRFPHWLLKRESQPTTALLRTTPTRTTNQLQTIDSENDFHTGCWNVSHNQQQPFSGLHQPGRSTNHKHWLWWWLPHWLFRRQSQPTTVLLGTTQTRTTNQLQTIDSENDFHTGCWNVSHNQQQPFSGLHQPGRSTNHKHWLWWWLPHWLSKRQSQPTTALLRSTQTRQINQLQTLTLKMTSTLVVETSVTTNNRPSQDYTNPDDQPTTMHWLWWWLPHWLSKRQSQPTTALLRNTPTWTINQPQTLTLMMTSTLVVEASVTTNNSPSQDYTNQADQHTANTYTVIV